MIVTHPYIRDETNEWQKELAVTMVKKGVEKLNMNILMSRLTIYRLNHKDAIICLINLRTD